MLIEELYEAITGVDQENIIRNDAWRKLEDKYYKEQVGLCEVCIHNESCSIFSSFRSMKKEGIIAEIKDFAQVSDIKFDISMIIKSCNKYSKYEGARDAKNKNKSQAQGSEKGQSKSFSKKAGSQETGSKKR